MFRINSVRLNSNYRISSVFCRKKHVWSSDKVIKSPFNDIVVPEMTVNEYMWRDLEKWPTKTATICGLTKRGYTYEQIYKQSRIFGANLRKKINVKDGDIVAIMMPNVPEYPIVVNGILEAGGIVTTINPVYTMHEVQKQIILSEAKLIIVHPNVVSIVKEAIKMSKKAFPVIVLDLIDSLPAETISYKELTEEKHADIGILKEVKRNTNDVAFLPYSSGTTGLPKGVELTHRNLIANLEQQNTECRLHSLTTETNQDPTLVVLPVFHSYGMMVVMLHKLSAGLKLVTLPKFSPETFLKALLEYKIRLLFLAAPMVLFLGSNPQVTSKHLEHLKCVISGAAPCSKPDIDKLLDRLQPDTHFGQGYGMTEASPLVTVSPLGYKNLSSSGFAIPNIEMRVVDGGMKNLGPNEVGELLIKGPNIMKGYKNNPEATRDTFIDDEWYRSGDMARIDETGAVYIADRLKELIKVNAYQVPPAELESVVKEHPAVFDAAVVGVPDPVTGEKPRAFVVLKDGVKVKEEEILKFVSERVAPYKKIKEILFIESVPKNPSGKILRRVLKEKYC